MMKVKKVLLSIGLALAAFVGVTGQQAQTAQAESLKYNVGAVLPSNQMPNSKVTYFDLLVKPDTEQTLQVRINNQDSQAHDYTVETNRASTNRNGVIDYSDHGAKADKSLKYNIEDLVSAKQKVTVPANTSATVDIKLKSPAKTFNGVILGGVRIAQKTDDKATSKKGVTITNQFAYVIGLQLHSDQEAVKPDLHLLKVSPKQFNYRNYITATLQNDQPTIMRDFAVNAYITKRGQDKKYVTLKKENMAMAPNSNFTLPIGDESYRLEPGKYTLYLKATADSKKYKWNFKKDFEITSSAANKLNKTSVDEPEKPNYTIWLILIGVIIILLLIFLIILLMRRKKKDDEDDKHQTEPK
ncbi:DUF916 and DUF3324 domain-containing protein [Lapidilactobacillus luobeiensis]|uniref:DUF916 and DUF3324 domain-containing protein n=1 Tax=Lapidilactobacillus luobeiensis TaxID=2950371 RepID=UPI0021C3F90C|nr:DUF916 and DUF3324 domain-containing protein [Lapidilactobacillus luobeiensis]